MPSYKRLSKPVGEFRDKTSVRRSRFLENQSKTRQSVFEELREKALDALLNHTIEESTLNTPSNSADKPRNKHQNQFAPKSSQYVSSQLIIPDFLIDVPANLASEWFAFLRPEGKRVVVIASGGHCCIFDKSGYFLDSFPTALPPSGCTILDGVLVTPPFHSMNGNSSDIQDLHYLTEENLKVLENEGGSEEVYRSSNDSIESEISDVKRKKRKRKKAPKQWIAICDCLCWNDCAMADSTAECRYFMLKSRFDEMKDILENVTSTNGRSLRMVDLVEACSDELARLYYYSHSPESIPDSIIFVHKESPYTPGISQLYLCWRDSSISRFPIDTTDATGRSIPPHQQTNLLLRLNDAFVFTEDRVIVARLKKETLQKQLESLSSTIYLTKWMKGKIKDELLIRVSIRGLALEALPDDTVNVDEVCATDLLVGMKIIGTPSPKRVRAETLNRIIHQFILRQTRIRNSIEPYQVNSAICTDEDSHEVPFVYNGPLLEFETIINCAATGEPHSRMLMLRGERNMEEFLEEQNLLEAEPEFEEWC